MDEVEEDSLLAEEASRMKGIYLKLVPSFPTPAQPSFPATGNVIISPIIPDSTSVKMLCSPHQSYISGNTCNCGDRKSWK